ncbi:MAG: Threonine synthase [Candidatus Falkowbacteria bacterium GW2011_GWF2_39_8]|uniref:Threonine synthase n=1 Tax=Candidatus Falkowbacteria bacterium GW2011_GWF2_39_8 TaxID=1618642 RepID=A0A0G0PWF8_9BACT|nr:MAG: Threonine synthase [Candidatus Falkowbacteria bacterium GW2011_GWF2_39_8]
MSNEAINFVSTNGPETATFCQAVMMGKAPNGGLWLPQRLHRFSIQEIAAMSQMSLPEIAYQVLRPYISKKEIPDLILVMILERIYDEKVMPLSLIKVGDRYVLRLDQGPTLAFKDIGMMFLINILNYLYQKNDSKLGVCAATSGDTGGAASENCEGLSSILCITSFVKGKPSDEQRVFMTTNQNTIALQLEEGTFDVCQGLFNWLLDDHKFAREITGDPTYFGTVNSINVGRLLPQMIYVFWAYSRLLTVEKEPPFIPSGNLGDATATEMARRMGLPIPRIGIAHNENRVFHSFLEKGVYEARLVHDTDSQSMDIGDPNNMPRLIKLFHGQMDGSKHMHFPPNLAEMRKTFISHWISNREHREIIRRIFKAYGYESDPHGAAGHAACDQFIEGFPEDWKAVVYQTANPDKFRELMQDATGKRPVATAILEKKLGMKETVLKILSPPDYVKVKGEDKAIPSIAQYQELKEILAVEIPRRLHAS